jgi:hypothetical protein
VALAVGHAGHVEVLDGDYDCLDDLIAAGLLSVAMPAVNDDGFFVDAHGRAIRWEGEAVPAGFVSGMTECYLAQYARFSLTEKGQRVASELRAHKGNGGNFHSFVPSEVA